MQLADVSAANVVTAAHIPWPSTAASTRHDGTGSGLYRAGR